ncbi:MAG: hypothetical protein DHS20C18_37160 [Saprospiraceae bacterium]|nr:MAG: hypothetical protein DHS20C18_37160 [Saprospiraceae bacterium]
MTFYVANKWYQIPMRFLIRSTTKHAHSAASLCHSGYAKAKVGSGIGALAVKKKAAARTAQEEILFELKTIKNQKPKRPTIK